MKNEHESGLWRGTALSQEIWKGTALSQEIWKGVYALSQEICVGIYSLVRKMSMQGSVLTLVVLSAFLAVSPSVWGQAAITRPQKQQASASSAQSKPTTGNLKVSYEPSGVEVWIDGSKAGTSPSTITKVKAGERTVELRMAGYLTETYQVSVKAGITSVLSGSLKPEPKEEVTVVEEEFPEEEVDVTRGKIGNLEWVDLGLPSGTKWATCNVGASSESDFGAYYSWGEISPKNTFEETNSSSYGVYLPEVSGDKQHDAAVANWGSPWRLPTRADIEEIVSAIYCTWTWTEINGVKGVKVTSNKNGNYIFLPAGGRKGKKATDVGSSGSYWTGTPDPNGPRHAFDLNFNKDGSHGVNGSRRFWGQLIRPVTD